MVDADVQWFWIIDLQLPAICAQAENQFQTKPHYQQVNGDAYIK